MNYISKILNHIKKKKKISPGDHDTKKLIIVDSRIGETRVAHVNHGVLEHLESEMWNAHIEQGNIYRAKISHVETSLQAAFVDYGKEKQGFLPFAEIHPSYLLPLVKDPTLDVTDMDQKDLVKKVDMHHLKDTTVLMQIVKDIRGAKGAALTTFLALKGQYTVLLANTPGTMGVSKKITNEQDRLTIKEYLNSIPLADTMGVIARSACVGQTKKAIKNDIQYLTNLWKKIEPLTDGPIELLYEENNLLIRTLRDAYRPDTDAVIIQQKQAYDKGHAFLRSLNAKNTNNVILDTENDWFDALNIDAHIASLDQNTIPLASGGVIVIDTTEALVAIDVNSAKSRQHRTIEDTAFQTNIEAAKTIARQVRLRDLSGLIVIDFIDMPVQKRDTVAQVLKEAFAHDPAVIRIGTISEFGLLEMSRQRLRQTVLERRTQACHACDGLGRTLLPSVAAAHTIRTLWSAIENNTPVPTVTLHIDPAIVVALMNEYRPFVQDVENHYGIKIMVHVDSSSDHKGSIVGHDNTWSAPVFGPQPHRHDKNKKTTDIENHAVAPRKTAAQHTKKPAKPSADASGDMAQQDTPAPKEQNAPPSADTPARGTKKPIRRRSRTRQDTASSAQPKTSQSNASPTAGQPDAKP